MTLLEAMQQACVPVVFKSFSAVLDMVDDKENGLLVEKGNLEEFSDKTLQLAKSPELMKTMSDNAVSKVKQFEVDRIIERWKELLAL